MSTEVIAAPAVTTGTPAERPPSVLKAVAGLAFALAFGFVAFAWGLGTGIRGDDVLLLVLALLTLIAGFLPLILDAARPPRRRSVILSMVGIMYGLQFSVPVFVHYIPVVGPTDPPGMGNINLMPADVARGQLLGLVGLLAIYAGHALPIQRLLAGVVPPPKHEWTESGTLGAALILIPSGWALFAAARLGLLPERLGGGFLGGFTDLALIAPALLVASFLRYRSRLSLVLLIIVPVTSAFNFLSSSKDLILMPWAMLALTYIVYTRRVQLRWFVAGGIAIILLFPAAQFLRHVVLQGYSISFAQVLKDPAEALGMVASFVGERPFSEYFQEGVDRTSGRLDALGHPAVIIRDTPDVVPFQNGRTIGLILLSYVPRLVWPDKPVIGIGMWIQENYNKSFNFVQSHLGPSWIGEFYLNFGTPGIVIGMMFLGLIFRVWFELLAGRGQTIPLMVAEVVVIKDIILQLTGGLVAVVNGPVNGVIPLIGIHLLLRFFGATRRVDEAGAAPLEEPGRG